MKPGRELDALVAEHVMGRPFSVPSHGGVLYLPELRPAPRRLQRGLLLLVRHRGGLGRGGQYRPAPKPRPKAKKEAAE